MDRGQVGDDVLGTVAGHDGDEVIRADSDGDQTGRCFVDRFAILRPGEVTPEIAFLPVERSFVAIGVGVSIKKSDEGLALDCGINRRAFGGDVSWDHQFLALGAPATLSAMSLTMASSS